MHNANKNLQHFLFVVMILECHYYTDLATRDTATNSFHTVDLHLVNLFWHHVHDTLHSCKCVTAKFMLQIISFNDVKTIIFDIHYIDYNSTLPQYSSILSMISAEISVSRHVLF